MSPVPSRSGALKIRLNRVSTTHFVTNADLSAVAVRCHHGRFRCGVRAATANGTAMGCAALKMPCGVRRRRTGPTVDLVVGSEVREAVASPSERRLILVFGGPGSRKGQIVNDLANCFGFEMVSAEKLILAYFSRHLHLDEETSGPVESTQCVEEMLKGDQNLVSLWLLLELLGQELDSRWRPGMVFLADPVPNLRYMLPSKRQLRRCQRDMQLFEKQKRYQEYTETVHELLQYFRDANRLVVVDVPRDASLVSQELVKFLASLGFVPRCTLDPSLVFLPGSSITTQWLRANGDRVDRVSSFTAAQSKVLDRWLVPQEGQQGLLERPMRLANQPNRRFYTVCWEKPADQGDRKERQVLFSGVEKLVGDKTTRSVGTALGETYLFPEDTDWNACRQVALLCSKHLHWQCIAGDQRNGEGVSQPFSSDA